MSDLTSGTLIQGSGVATATATLTVPAGRRGYLLAASVETLAGTCTFCRLEIRSAGSPVFAQTFLLAGNTPGGSFVFPMFVAMTLVNQDLTIVATTTGATSTNVYGIVQLGP